MAKEKKEEKLNPFEQTIKNYLDQRAAQDELFAVTYAKPDKNLKECCNYVMECAKKGGRQGYDDSEVYNWAVHYYDEDDIKNIKPVSGKVVVNHSIELTEEEKDKARTEAIAQFTAEEKKKIILDYKPELTEEDMAIARDRAINEAVEEAKKKMLEKKKAKAIKSPEAILDQEKETKKEEVSQGSLF